MNGLQRVRTASFRLEKSQKPAIENISGPIKRPSSGDIANPVSSSDNALNETREDRAKIPAQITNTNDEQIKKSVENKPLLMGPQETFNSTYEYFQRITANSDVLEQTLKQNDAILDIPEEHYKGTLLHFIANKHYSHLSHIVEPYLTPDRIAAKNAEGQTILDILVIWADHLDCHEYYGQFLGHCIKKINEVSFESVKKHAHPNGPGTLLAEQIKEINKKIRWLDELKKDPSPNYLVGNPSMQIESAKLVLKYLELLNENTFDELVKKLDDI